MHATIDRLASREIVGFLKKKTQRQWNLRGDPGGWAEEKNARTQGRKGAKTQRRKGCGSTAEIGYRKGR